MTIRCNRLASARLTSGRMLMAVAMPVPDPLSVLPLETIPPGVMRDIYALWLDRFSPGRLPARRDFEPAAMPNLLPHLNLLDVEREPFRLRVRLIGTAIVSASGIDITGRYLDEFQSTDGTISRCRNLVEQRQPHFFAGLPLAWSPRNYKTYSVVGMPLASDGVTVDMILGALTFQ